MLRALFTAVLLLGLPATASAAPLRELPFRPAGGAVACLTPTGKGSEVARWVRDGVELLEAGTDGLRPTGRLDLGRYWSCPVVASDPNGAAVLAVGVLDEQELEFAGLRVVLREPGATGWSAPVTLPIKRFQNVEVAVSPRGDVVIAWLEYEPGDDDFGIRFRAVRRAAGGAFGAIETLTPFGDGGDDAIEVGMTATGEAIVAYSASELSGVADVVVRSGVPGAPLGAPRALVTAGAGGASPVLAVAPDGRVLVVSGDHVYERPPGGDFGAGQPLELGAGTPAIALRADGAAVIASARDWQTAAAVVSRSAPGPFGPRIEVAPARPWQDNTLPGFGASPPTSNPPLEPYPDVSLTLGADGRALLVRPTDERHGRNQRGLQTVSFPVAAPLPGSAAHPFRSTAVERGTFGGTIRDAAGFSPLVLADGRFAVAWSDERGRTGAQDGRLHLAVEGAAAAREVAAPTVTVGKPDRRALRPAQSLVVPVRCSAACDVRVVVRGKERADATGSLARAGTMRVRLSPIEHGLRIRRDRVRLTVHVSAPAARTVQRRNVTLSVRRLPAPPLPRILDLRARRSGEDLLVRWRLDRPLIDAFLFVIGSRVGRVEDDDDAIFVNARRIEGRTYGARLKRAGRVRHVRVYAVSLVPSRNRVARLSVPLLHNSSEQR